MGRISHTVLTEESFEISARKLFDHCCKLTGATSGYVALLSDDGRENEVVFLEAGGMPCTVDESLPMPIRGLREVAYRTQKPAIHNDFANSKWMKFMPEGHVHLRNVMFAPLVIDGKARGLIGLANKDGDFTEEDANLAMSFGDVAAIALQNADYKKALEEAKSSLDAFSYSITHDLKAPSRQVASIINMIRDHSATESDENLKELLDMASSSAEDMNELVQSLFALSVSSNNSINLENIDIIILAESLFTRIKQKDPDREVEFVCPESALVQADETLLKDVLRNLLRNAWKYTRNEKSARIELLHQQKDGMDIVSIKDNGIGFPEEEAEDLFKPFKRLSNAKGFRGSGIGLATVKKIIERHGGSIWAESVSEKGSVFHFSLPAAC